MTATITITGAQPVQAARVLLDNTSLGQVCLSVGGGAMLTVTAPAWPLSGGEQELWNVLVALGGGGAVLSLWDLAAGTDDTSWAAVLDALAVLRPRAEVSA